MEEECGPLGTSCSGPRVSTQVSIAVHGAKQVKDCEDLHSPTPPIPTPTGVFHLHFFKKMLPSPTCICNEALELCGGNIIKLVKDVKDEEWDDIRLISHLAVG